MSYPEPRYLGETGERSAWIRRADTEPDLVFPGGGSVDHLATGAVTDGGFGLYRWRFGPEQSGPDPHFHRTMSESFFVLSGTVEIHDGADWRPTHAGDFSHVPPGGIHGFRNVVVPDEPPASMLLLFAPGAPREAYFETLKQLREGLTMTDAEREAFFLAHDNVWV